MQYLTLQYVSYLPNFENCAGEFLKTIRKVNDLQFSVEDFLLASNERNSIALVVLTMYVGLFVYNRTYNTLKMYYMYVITFHHSPNLRANRDCYGLVSPALHPFPVHRASADDKHRWQHLQ